MNPTYPLSSNSASASFSLILTVFIDWNGNSLQNLFKNFGSQQYCG